VVLRAPTTGSHQSLHIASLSASAFVDASIDFVE
jgi:hypothetical protein